MSNRKRWKKLKKPNLRNVLQHVREELGLERVYLAKRRSQTLSDSHLNKRLRKRLKTTKAMKKMMLTMKRLQVKRKIVLKLYKKSL